MGENPRLARAPMTFLQFVNTTAIAALVGGIAFLAVSAGKSRIAAAIYADKLEKVASDYEQVRGMYNDAVTRSAVTELVVAGSKLSVRIRTITGVVQEIPTPFDPAGEIYADYVVLDGRLWIRRVFDAKTAPGTGLVIDPALANVQWKDKPMSAVGKAVYRSLSEGRWVVTVSGDGSLGLGKVDGPVELERAPKVRDYKSITDDAAKEVGAITLGDVWRWLTKSVAPI